MESRLQQLLIGEALISDPGFGWQLCRHHHNGGAVAEDLSHACHDLGRIVTVYHHRGSRHRVRNWSGGGISTPSWTVFERSFQTNHTSDCVGHVTYNSSLDGRNSHLQTNPSSGSTTSPTRSNLHLVSTRVEALSAGLV